LAKAEAIFLTPNGATAAAGSGQTSGRQPHSNFTPRDNLPGLEEARTMRNNRNLPHETLRAMLRTEADAFVIIIGPGVIPIMKTLVLNGMGALPSPPRG
jgi:hypothetical protein